MLSSRCRGFGVAYLSWFQVASNQSTDYSGWRGAASPLPRRKQQCEHGPFPVSSVRARQLQQLRDPLPHITSQSPAPTPSAPPAHFLRPTWSWWAIVRFKQMDGEQRGERGPPLPVPLVSLPTRLWVIFSSFHGRAMNNPGSSLRPSRPPLISPSADLPGPAAPRIASLTPAFSSVSSPSTPNQDFLFLGACYKAWRLIEAVAGWHLVWAS